MKAADCPHIIDALMLLEAEDVKPTVPGLKRRIIDRFSNITSNPSPAATRCELCPYSVPHVWACLSCSYQGCGRSQNRHAAKHLESHPDHTVCVNIDSQMFWCYGCDEELELEPEEHLKELTNRNEVIVNQLLYTVCQTLNPPPSDDEDDRSDESTTSNEGTQTTQRRNRYLWDEAIDHLRSEHEIARDLTPAGSPPRGLCGLQNIGNTCYMNSALQCLSNTAPMRRVFLGPQVLSYSTSRSAPIKALTDDYGHLVWNMWSGAHTYIAPQRLHYRASVINPLFRGRAQHDAQEFLRTLLDSLHESLKRNDYAPRITQQKNANASSSPKSASSASSTSPTPTTTEKPKTSFVPTESSISALFEGQLLSTVVCGHCGRASETQDRFFDLSLSIPTDNCMRKISLRKEYLANGQGGGGQTYGNNDKAGAATELLDFQSEGASSSPGLVGRLWGGVKKWFSSTPETDLESCLHGFCVPDELTGPDQYRCEHCKKLHDATKAFTIAKPPHILCLHIKRFRYDFFGSKVSDYVKFPLYDLDLTDFCAPPLSPPNDNTPSNPTPNGHLKSNDTSSSSGKKSPKRKKKQPKAKQSDKESPAPPTTVPPLYNLHAVICHSGSLSGGHYYAYAKHPGTQLWYEFNDSSVAEVDEATVLGAEAYVLFYEQQTPESISDLREGFKSEIRTFLEDKKRLEETNPDLDVLPPETPYVSLTWLTKWLLLNNPGPINAPALTCAHNHPLAVGVNHWVPLPDHVATHFTKTYGGNLMYRTPEPCASCEAEKLERLRKEEEERLQQEQLAARRQTESNQVTKLGGLLKDPKEVRKGYYFVDTEWVRLWLNFARGDSDDIPGPIDNKQLMKGHVTKDRYRALNHAVWKYLHNVYGGGPEVWAKTSKFPQSPTSRAESSDNSTSDDEYDSGDN